MFDSIETGTLACGLRCTPSRCNSLCECLRDFASPREYFDRSLPSLVLHGTVCKHFSSVVFRRREQGALRMSARAQPMAMKSASVCQVGPGHRTLGWHLRATHNCTAAHATASLSTHLARHRDSSTFQQKKRHEHSSPLVLAISTKKMGNPNA